jgi:DNA-binding response OmpR family regulator
MRVLIIEDEQRIAAAIKQGLEQEAYAVDIAFDGDEGYRSAVAEEYDILVVDVMLPTMNGYDICRQLRNDGIHTPIILLTAKDQTSDIITGLDSGADDYLAKPFSFEVLLARMRALLRRPHETASEVLSAGDLQLNPATHSVVRAGTPLNLTVKEFGILEYLLRNKGRILSKNNIMTHVWDFDADILPNTVEVFITYLRNKIEKPFPGPPIIHTVRGVGYKIED